MRVLKKIENKGAAWWIIRAKLPAHRVNYFQQLVLPNRAKKAHDGNLRTVDGSGDLDVVFLEEKTDFCKNIVVDNNFFVKMGWGQFVSKIFNNVFRVFGEVLFFVMNKNGNKVILLFVF